MKKLSANTPVPTLDSFSDGGSLSAAKSLDQELHLGLHSHPHGELFLLHAGHLQARSEAGNWLIPSLQICWIPPYAPHGSHNRNVEWTRLHLDSSLCASLPPQPCVWTSTPLTRAVFERLAQRSDAHKAVSAAEQRLLDVLFDELAIARAAALLLPMPSSPRLRALAESWQMQPGEMTGLDKLAVSFGMSRRTLTRTFRQETGMSVGKWRQVARLMTGIDMLSQGASVTHTAMSLGYDSVSSFVSLCQRLTGMSPKTLAQAVPHLPR